MNTFKAQLIMIVAFGLFAISVLIAANAAPYMSYACKAKSQDEYRIGRENGHVCGLWYCDLPDRIEPHYLCGSLDNIPDLIATPSIDKIGAYIQSVVSRKATPEEFALVQKTHTAQGAKILVAPNGTTTTRPTYFRTSTNTKGADTGKRASSGAWCGWKRLQDSAGKSTMYFEVGDAPGTYTQCVVVGAVTK